LCRERCFEGWKTEEGAEGDITRRKLEEMGERYKRVVGFDAESLMKGGGWRKKWMNMVLGTYLFFEREEVKNIVEKVETGMELS
jgi:hypothetical protein